MTPKDFIKSKVRYDNSGQYFFNQEGQMIAELRGWGAIQQLFRDKKGNYDLEAAGKFQDEVGVFIAEAINEKMLKS